MKRRHVVRGGPRPHARTHSTLCKLCILCTLCTLCTHTHTHGTTHLNENHHEVAEVHRLVGRNVLERHDLPDDTLHEVREQRAHREAENFGCDGALHTAQDRERASTSACTVGSAERSMGRQAWQLYLEGGAEKLKIHGHLLEGRLDPLKTLRVVRVAHACVFAPGERA